MTSGFARKCQRGLAIHCLDHAVAFPAHCRREEVAAVRIVIDHHDQRRMLGSLGDHRSSG
jgi:hypothetical protein